MIRKHASGLNLTFLLIFLLFSAFIHFLHNHNGPQAGNSCPACHFQNSTVTTAHIHFFVPPQLDLLGDLQIFESHAPVLIIPIAPLSRSPPRV